MAALLIATISVGQDLTFLATEGFLLASARLAATRLVVLHVELYSSEFDRVPSV